MGSSVESGDFRKDGGARGESRGELATGGGTARSEALMAGRFVRGVSGGRPRGPGSPGRTGRDP